LEGANRQIEPGQFTEAKPSTEERKHKPDAPTPRIQAAPTHHPQPSDRRELERELAQFKHDNLSGRDLERIVELLEKFNATRNGERGTHGNDADAAGDEDERAEGLPTDEEITEKEQGTQETQETEQEEEDDAEGEQLGDSPAEDGGMTAQGQEEQGIPSAGQEGEEGAGTSPQPQLGGEGIGIGDEWGQDGEGEMGFMGRGNRGAAGLRNNPAQWRGTPENMGERQDIPRFNMPLSNEAAQTLTAAFLNELIMDDVAPAFGGRLARLMNPEQGASFAQQHQMALDLWMPTIQERERLLRSLEYVVGRLLLQDCITTGQFAEYGALFDEHLKAQTTIAGAGAETHLKDMEALAVLLSRYKERAHLLRIIVSQLSTAMQRLLSRRMPIYAKSSGGKLDVRKTIRQSLQYGGIPMDFIYR